MSTFFGRVENGAGVRLGGRYVRDKIVIFV